MSMHGLLSSLTDKAQSALSNTPFGRSSSQGANESGAAQSSSGGILKSHAFESIHHQLRSFQQQYSSSVTPVQKIITTQKGVALDLDNVSRDELAHSKELYMWSQAENEDLKDVTDRLAWMSYVEGSLAATLAKGVDASRAPFKTLRDAENGLSGRRNIRATLENQIARIENDQRRGQEQKVAELKRQLRSAEEEDEPLEKEVELLKRKALRESERIKWDAIREYAEKLSLVAQAATAALPALPDIPSSKFQPYAGAALTASIRTTLQHALDHWQVGDSTLLLREPTAADLHRADTRSFGETHAKELARINAADPAARSSLPDTPPAVQDHPPRSSSHNANAPPPASSISPASSTSGVGVPSPTIPKASVPASPPLNPAVLNQAPAPIPLKAVSPNPFVAPDPIDPSLKIPAVTPTVAETGMPQSAGPEGPGPASGSLKDIKHESPILQPQSSVGTASAQYESAEDEKKRLEREQRERILRQGGSIPVSAGATFESAEEEKKRLEREERERILQEGGSGQKYETAEEEKKRLEREDRERILAAGGPSNLPDGKQQAPDGDSLPPYQEF